MKKTSRKEMPRERPLIDWEVILPVIVFLGLIALIGAAVALTAIGAAEAA